jgi:hypothetical protein
MQQSKMREHRPRPISKHRRDILAEVVGAGVLPKLQALVHSGRWPEVGQTHLVL